MEKQYLNDIHVRVEQKDNIYRVVYEVGNFSGWCEYVLYETKGVNKPIVQRNYIMTNTDMGDIIEYLHKKSPLSSEDLSSINKLIRDHSLSVVQNYLNDLH